MLSLIFTQCCNFYCYTDGHLKCVQFLLLCWVFLFWVSLCWESLSWVLHFCDTCCHLFSVASLLLLCWVSLFWASHFLLCWMPIYIICRGSLCRVSLSWVSLCWVSLYWMSWRLRNNVHTYILRPWSSLCAAFEWNVKYDILTRMLWRHDIHQNGTWQNEAWNILFIVMLHFALPNVILLR